MQSRVVGQMESWRGQGRRAGRDALGRLAAAWKAGSEAGRPGGRADPGEGRPGVNGAAGTPMARDGTADQHQAGRPEQALVSMPDRRDNTAEHNRVPGWLQTGAAWSWRLLLLAAGLYLIARVIGMLYIVVVPCTAALLLTGLVLLVTNRVSADYPTLVDETRHTTTQVESWLSGAPFHIKSSTVQKALNDIPGYLSKHKALVEGTVVTGGKIAAEFFGGV